MFEFAEEPLDLIALAVTHFVDSGLPFAVGLGQDALAHCLVLLEGSEWPSRDTPSRRARWSADRAGRAASAQPGYYRRPCRSTSARIFVVRPPRGTTETMIPPLHFTVAAR